MERLKELAENLIVQVNQNTEKRELLETVLEMMRFLAMEENKSPSTTFQTTLSNQSEEPSSLKETIPSLNEVLRGVEEDVSEQLTHSKIYSLRQAIGINDRFVFVEKLFGNSIGRFEKVIDLMDKSESYEASEQILIDELTQHMPEDASPALINQLLSLVRRRFSSK